MKIVLILGNGFDLDLGLKTSYKNFWESKHCPKDYPAPLIDHLNSRWGDELDSVRWYDLENELLCYYDKIKKFKEYPDSLTSEERECLREINFATLQYGVNQEYLDIVDSLCKKNMILRRAQPPYNYYCPYKEDAAHNSIWRDKRALELIKGGVCQYVSEAYKEGPRSATIGYNLLNTILESKRNGNSVKIYSFNYTPLPNPFARIFADLLFYVHGSCKDGNIIIGTKEYSEYTPDYDFLQKSFDPNFNPPKILPDLLDADEVIFFGHSLGDNDSQYFKAFFNSQINQKSYNPKQVYIFTRDDNSEMDIKRSINKLTNYNFSSFTTMNEVKIIKQTSVLKDISVFNEFVEKHVEEGRMDEFITYIHYDD